MNALLSRYFVPAYENYCEQMDKTAGSAPADRIREQGLRLANLMQPCTALASWSPQRVAALIGDGQRVPPTTRPRQLPADMDGSTVPVFILILMPRGAPLGLLVRPDMLDVRAELERCIARLHLQPAAALLPEAAAPARGGLSVHTVARFLQMPSVKSEDRPSYMHVPAEAWTELDADEWRSFVPPANDAPGDAWTIPDAVTQRLFASACPPAETWIPQRTMLRQPSLRATLASREDGVDWVLLRGSTGTDLVYVDPLLQSMWGGLHRVDRNMSAQATFRGYARIDSKSRTVLTLRIASDEGTWRRSDMPLEGTYGVAIRSL